MQLLLLHCSHRKKNNKSWYSLGWLWPGWEGLISGCLWWSGLIAGLNGSPLITGDGGSFSSFIPPWFGGALCCITSIRKSDTCMWRHNITTALNSANIFSVQPVQISHLFGLHVVRWRLVRNRWELRKLWGMHHERGRVVPHVTCKHKGR